MNFIIISYPFLFLFLAFAIVFFCLGRFLSKMVLLFDFISLLSLFGYIITSLLLKADYAETIIFSLATVLLCLVIHLVREKLK